MFNLLCINAIKEFIVILIIFIVICLIAFLLIKSPFGRKIVGIIFGIIVIIVGLFTASANYEYFSIRGGVWGTLQDLLNQNEVVQDNLLFRFTNFNLIEKDNRYVAKFSIENVNVTMKDKVVLVNNSPTEIKARDNNYIFVSYNYSFIDEEMNEIINDELLIKFVFNKNHNINTSECIISTSGNSRCAHLWNKFFAKNDIEVKIESQNYFADTDLVIENYNTFINYYVNNELYARESYEVNETKELIDYPVEEGYIFFGWFSEKPFQNLKTLTGLEELNLTEGKTVNLYATYCRKDAQDIDGFSDSTIVLNIDFLEFDENFNTSLSYGSITLEYFDEELGYTRIYNFTLTERSRTITGLKYATYTVSCNGVRVVKVPAEYSFTTSYKSTITLNIPIVPSGYEGIYDISSI